MIDNEKKIMRGEFRGDFTRDTFDPVKAFSRVLMQQGRVQLDADWNEQNSILLHMIRNLATDICGPHWGPAGSEGFKISNVSNNDFDIGAGHYYVDGILCEVGEEFNYRGQSLSNELLNLTFDTDNNIYLIYLDVWERHISHVEDDIIREKALNGPDTASRAQVVWQVKVEEVLNTSDEAKDIENSLDSSIPPPLKVLINFLTRKKLLQPGTGTMQAKVKDNAKDNNAPCLVAPESRYRGTENQLYRVEIHEGGEVHYSGGDQSTGPTFKWSRENGSVIFPITKISGNKITLEHLGRDNRFGLKPNDWVEMVDDDYILQNLAYPLLQVIEVDNENIQVTLSDVPKLTIKENSNKHPYLRRWDQKSSDFNKNNVSVNEKGVSVKEGDAEQDWILLENGVEIQFPKSYHTGPHIYQTGDYWLIPARTATGDIEWPKDGNKKPKPLSPHGVIHHYAPLSIIGLEGRYSDLRRILKTLPINSAPNDTKANTVLPKKQPPSKKTKK